MACSLNLSRFVWKYYNVFLFLFHLKTILPNIVLFTLPKYRHWYPLMAVCGQLALKLWERTGCGSVLRRYVRAPGNSTVRLIDPANITEWYQNFTYVHHSMHSSEHFKRLHPFCFHRRSTDSFYWLVETDRTYSQIAQVLPWPLNSTDIAILFIKW